MTLLSDDIAALRDCTDIVKLIGRDTDLRIDVDGVTWAGACPFVAGCGAKFRVHVARELFHCSGCGAGGDVFSYLQQRDGLDFDGAAQALKAWLSAS